ncbi:MAG TPA: SDR family NAD(P)-dependent oxidoreductase [Dehalococcoidia bacterium]|nr:SDR family NAD(P)-dependent oxidoreductase [Dehalococcoidia bacterium]
MSLDGQVALVAGASRGIGADVAKALAAAGAQVGVAARTEQVQDARLPGTIHSVTAEIEADGGTAIPVVLNLRDAESIRAAAQRVVDEWGRLDILVNNAAIFVPGDLESVLDRHIELSLQVNLRGPILMMQAALPHMKASGGGRIINVSSSGSKFPGPGPYEPGRRLGDDLFYGPEKSAIEHFSQRQALQLQGDGISVNVLSPTGRIKTPGNLFFSNDKENPDTDFETAVAMQKGVVWICEQPADQYTGNIEFDDALVEKQGL